MSEYSAVRYLPVWMVLLITLVLPGRALAQGEERDKEMKIEDVAARNEARRARRLDRNGELKPDALIRAREDLERRIAGRPSTPATPSDAGIWNWEWLGPGNIGGRLRAIVIDPTNPNLMVVGTAGGGIWRSTNGGDWWFPVSDFLPSLPVVSLAMDPTNPMVIYAGTGELVGSNSSIPGAGIYKSTTSGLTWTHLTNTDTGDFRYVGRLAHHPTVTGTVLAATETGIHRTTDGGTTWSLLYSTTGAACDVDYDPADPNRIWVGTYSSVFLTTDGGASWSWQNSGAPGKMKFGLGRCEITFAPSRPHIVYVSGGNNVMELNDMADTIWRSTDAGLTWQKWMPTNADLWSNAIWVSPTDSNLVVWGGFGDLFRTTNGGVSFERISEWTEYDKGNSAHSDQHAIVAHPGYDGTTNRIVYFGNDGGIQKAADVKTVSQTSGWMNLANNLGVSQFFGGAVSPAGNFALGGTQDNGLLRYTQVGGQQGWTIPKNASEGWSMLGDGQYCVIDPGNPAIQYVTYPELEIWRSEDTGKTFSKKINGLDDALTTAGWLAPFVIDRNNPTALVAGGVRIWRTTDRGEVWTQIRAQTPSGWGCTSIDIANTSSAVIWVGYGDGQVAHTTNTGGIWTNHANPWGGVAVTDIAINPFNADEVFVTVGGYDTATVWLTTDAGGSWVNRNGVPPYDLPAIQVNTIRYHPLDENWIYVGTDLGVFASEDKGLTWSVTPRYSANEGPNNVEVVELVWQGTSYLVAITHGRGFYRCRPLPVVYVDYSYAGVEDGSQFKPFNTVEEAVANYGPGALISIKSGIYDGPVLVIDKRGRLTSTGGPTIIK